MSAVKKTGLAILTLELIALATLHARAPTGTIYGRITDPTGAAIPGARIVVTSKQTGTPRVLVTANEGDYSGPALLAGAYEVTAEAPGFQRLAREAVIEASSTTTVNLTMELGATTDTVIVDAASPRIHYDTRRGDRPRDRGPAAQWAKPSGIGQGQAGAQPPTQGSNNRTFVLVLDQSGSQQRA